MTNKYTALIPAYHCQFPNYFATVNAVTEAFVRQQDSTRGIVPAFDLDSAIGAQLDVIGLWVRRGRRIRAPAVNHYFSFDDPLWVSTRGHGRDATTTATSISIWMTTPIERYCVQNRRQQLGRYCRNAARRSRGYLSERRYHDHFFGQSRHEHDDHSSRGRNTGNHERNYSAGVSLD